MKILCVGDIHCKIWVINKVEKVVNEYDTIIFLGDYVDDWHATPLDNIITLIKLRSFYTKYPKKIKLVIGNHDFAYLHSEIAGRSSGYNFDTQMLINLPDNKELKEWLSFLPIMIELDGITFSHAGVTTDWSTKLDVEWLWRGNSPIWARYETSNYKKIPQCFGHTPQKTCTELEPNIWVVDTFSTYRDGTPIGDGTVLEIIDGTTFNILKLKEINNEHSNNSTSIKS